MNEFLKVNWRVTDINQLEPPESFITEDELEQSLVYEFFENKSLFRSKPQVNLFKNAAYVPGLPDAIETFTTKVKSTLDKKNHDTCLKVLKLFQSGKDPSCYTQQDKFLIEIFKKLKPKILEENTKYLTFVQQQWDKFHKFKCLPSKPGLVTFGERVWQQKWQSISSYPQFYNEIATINLSFNENESVIDYNCTGTALELGTLARFSPPNLQCPVTLTNVNLPDGEWWVKRSSSRMPVSRDRNVDKLLETRGDIDVVVSSSCLKCLADTSDGKRRWMIPFVVKTVGAKRVVFLDKPFYQNDMNHTDFVYMSFKRLIKTNFCQFEAFEFAQEEEEIENASTVSEEDKCRWTFNRHHNKILYNASYKVWNIKKTYCQNNLMKNQHKPKELNVLVRNKLDACELNSQGALHPAILNPKLELQHTYGANVASKSELSREWTSLFFTPFSHLYRVRIAAKHGEVLTIEKCNIQKITSEAHSYYQFKPQLALGSLQQVFEQLTQLQPGNYLLQHLPKHEAFVAVLKECPQNSVGTVFDFHAERTKMHVQEWPKCWLPIDVNFILPSFEAANRMPGLFAPVESLKRTKTKKKNGGNVGKKIKRNDCDKLQGSSQL
ncbi:uncharacterized protein LOC126746615 [Anthonomus grandis grandis]|uniref:uncharacterized protein LOC126746615 n=1 Tax=Anthonomus grandis grandis TaxID=2921223 RepID=UPI002165883C|nr:uncharacterized protein LOC126746615 [Anthonomus grandis grandis]